MAESPKDTSRIPVAELITQKRNQTSRRCPHVSHRKVPAAKKCIQAAAIRALDGQPPVLTINHGPLKKASLAVVIENSWPHIQAFFHILNNGHTPFREIEENFQHDILLEFLETLAIYIQHRSFGEQLRNLHNSSDLQLAQYEIAETELISSLRREPSNQEFIENHGADQFILGHIYPGTEIFIALYETIANQQNPQVPIKEFLHSSAFLEQAMQWAFSHRELITPLTKLLSGQELTNFSTMYREHGRIVSRIRFEEGAIQVVPTENFPNGEITLSSELNEAWIKEVGFKAIPETPGCPATWSQVDKSETYPGRKKTLNAILAYTQLLSDFFSQTYLPHKDRNNEFINQY